MPARDENAKKDVNVKPEEIGNIASKPKDDALEQKRNVEREQAAKKDTQKNEEKERDVSISDDSARQARERVNAADTKKKDAELDLANAKDDASREQQQVEVQYAKDQSKNKLAALKDAEDKAKQDNRPVKDVLTDNATDGKVGAKEELGRVQQAEDGLTPKADDAENTPHREQNAVEIMTHPEGGSAESRALGTSSPSATSGQAAVNITEIADSYDLSRGAALGMVVANDNSLAVFNTWLGQYQVRSGEGLATPTRKPDVQTMHGEWWQEGDEFSGYFIGRPLGTDGLVYRVPRMAASIPSLSRVRYNDPATEQEARESRKLSGELAAATESTVDAGLTTQVRPEAALSAHLDLLEGYDGARSSLGGFRGQAIVVPGNPADQTAVEQARLHQSFTDGNIARHVQQRELSGLPVSEQHKAIAENDNRAQLVKEGKSPDFDQNGGGEEGDQGAADEDAAQRKQFQAQEPTEEQQKIVLPGRNNFDDKGDHLESRVDGDQKLQK
jgi:hypothetical protein